MFLLSKVKWSPSIWLRQRCGIQNHHEDNVSRRSHPEARKLRERLALCLLRLQTSGFQVAQADGLQGETGKVILTFFFFFLNGVKNSSNIWHEACWVPHLCWSFIMMPFRKAFFFFIWLSHLDTHIIAVYCRKFLLLWLPECVWMFELRVFF